MTLKPKTQDLAAEWREARLLHPLYSALGREFVIELPSSCPDLESGLEDPPQGRDERRPVRQRAPPRDRARGHR